MIIQKICMKKVCNQRKQNCGISVLNYVHRMRNLYVLLHVVRNYIFSCMLCETINSLACCTKSSYSFAGCAKSIYSLACCAKSLGMLCKIYCTQSLAGCAKSIYSLAFCAKSIYSLGILCEIYIFSWHVVRNLHIPLQVVRNLYIPLA